VSIVVALIVGALAVRFVVVAGHDILGSRVLERENYRGHHIPTAAGVLAVIAVLLIEGATAFLGAVGVGDEPGGAVKTLFLLAVVGFGFVGFFDDMLGNGDHRGFKGHLSGLWQGRVTTGLLKIVGGASLALVLVGAASNVVDGKQILVDAALVALAANMVNLLDRAPGRAIKVAFVAWIATLFATHDDPIGVALAPIMGAFLGLLGDDLRERLMIGDTGSYVLGGAIGLAVVFDTGRSTRIGVLIALVALTLAAEFVSYSTVIDRVPPLRFLDRLGQRKRDQPA
jgi:UDP-N-acetylmuramyl pentapeptide phosphotransferase/UDP-N-acetylglucosamine-1-phosphate transferase